MTELDELKKINRRLAKLLRTYQKVYGPACEGPE